MELKKIVKSTSYLMFTKILRFFVGIIRAKINAIFLGTTGVGIVSQLNTLTLQISRFTLLSMNDGLVKQLAQNKDHEDFKTYLANAVKSYGLIVLFTTILSVTLLFVFSEKLTLYFFGDLAYENYFIIGVFSLPILILTSLSFALLKAFKGLKHIANSNIITLFISFVLFIPLVYYFKITGAVISIVITYLLRLFTNTFYSRKHVLKPLDITYGDIARGHIKKDNLKELFVFAGVGLSIGALQIGSEVVCRSIVVSQIGIDQLGIYAPNVAWGGLFTGFILPSLYTYLYPRFSEAKTNREISGVLNDVLRMISFMMIPFLFGGIGFRYVLIPAFYSGEFMEAATYLPGHFFGIFFFMIMEAFSQVFAPTGKIKVIGVLKGIMFILNVGIVYYFVTRFGLVGWMLKFLITPILFTLIFFLYLRKKYEFKLEMRNLILILFVLLTGGGLYYISDLQPLYGLILSVILMPVSLFFSTKNERNQVVRAMTKLKNRFSRKK